MCSAVLWFSGITRFKFRGCGWRKAYPVFKWSESDKAWIAVMNLLFVKMFGEDFLDYTYNKQHGTKVSQPSDPRSSEPQTHEEWEAGYRATEAMVIETEENWLKTVPAATRKINIKCRNAAEGGPVVDDDDAHKDEDNNNNDSDGDDSDCDDDDETAAEILEVSVQGDQRNTEDGCNDEAVANKHPTAFDHRPSVPPAESQYDNIRPDIATAKFDQQIWKQATRAQRASFISPCVSAQITAKDVVPLFGNFSITSPLDLPERPCEDVIQKSSTLLNKRHSSGERASGVKIGLLGQFDRDGLGVLRDYSAVARTHWQVRAEMRWLDQANDLQDSEKTEIGMALWHRSPRETIIRHGKKAIDVESFSALVQERFLDNMTIDICIERYHQDAQSVGHFHTVYLPCELWEWLKCNNQFLAKQIQPLLANLCGHKVKYVLSPVHMPSHWGLLFIDVEKKLLHFDDGLKRPAPAHLLGGIQRVLGVLHQQQPQNKELSCKFWLSDGRFHRFGMPSQRQLVTEEGSGSCGVGVILAARDFMMSGRSAISSFSWCFNNMKAQRGQLMLQILKWS